MERVLRKWIVLAFATVFLSSCTIARYEINNKLNRVQTKNNGKRYDIKYSFDITSGSHTNTFGAKTDSDERTLKFRKKYREAIENVFKRENYSAIQVEGHEGTANFIIHIERQISLSALPQEWLTGLSFGLIPSWGTRPSQFIYTFENKESKKKHSYIIDEKSYNHIILFPVFWVSFITLDEYNVFENTLINFIESS